MQKSLTLKVHEKTLCFFSRSRPINQHEFHRFIILTVLRKQLNTSKLDDSKIHFTEL